MKREIRFRGKRIDTGEWVYGNLLQVSGLCFIVKNIEELTEKPFNACLVDADTVGQYTGLKDRQKQDIYDGDLLKSGDIIFEVWWSDDAACYMLDMVNPFKEMSTSMSSADVHKMVIIGNIHDNPELLEEGK